MVDNKINNYTDHVRIEAKRRGFKRLSVIMGLGVLTLAGVQFWSGSEGSVPAPKPTPVEREATGNRENSNSDDRGGVNEKNTEISPDFAETLVDEDQ